MIKNVAEIKAEAKEQIKDLLEYCDCYGFTDEGIDIWLNEWEKACAPQIEAIAEKSPYYNGRAQIVFPSEYPRDIDPVGIDSFCKWLYGFADRNLNEARINGLTYNEARYARAFKNYIDQCAVYFNEANDCIPDDISENFDTLRNAISDNKSFFNACNEAYRDYDYEDGVRMMNGKYYLSEDLTDNNIYDINMLSDILRQSYAKSQFVSDRLADVLNSNFSRCGTFTSGQKLSRAVNKIATKLGITKDADWNRAFANYADAINPLVIKKWTVLSWHPMDYLTFCFGNSWSTCSTIDKKNVRAHKIHSSHSSITSYVDTDGDYAFAGESAAAALSYMFDKTSFIYYTVNGKYEGSNYEEQDKESRIVFSLSEDNTTLLQSRLYPQCNDDTDGSGYNITREIVQKVIADALEVPNLWKVRVGSEACREVCSSNGVHYDDWRDERNNKVSISWLKDITEEPHTIKLGHAAICPRCGETHWHQSSLNCEECDPLYDNY